MINIVTVHWRSPRWIDPQLSYLASTIDTPYRVFASLNGIADHRLSDRFHFAADLEGSHAEKLNALAAVVLAEADPDDRLVFLDGDAFPVRPIGRWMDDVLDSYPLAAVRRDENLGDVQPHPCFTFTTCRFWADLGGDWREGGTWTSASGQETTDVGGTLLHQLRDGGHDWLPILRTNRHNPEPLCFGVYGHRVYHHGAGFRPPVTPRGGERLDGPAGRHRLGHQPRGSRPPGGAPAVADHLGPPRGHPPPRPRRPGDPRQAVPPVARAPAAPAPGRHRTASGGGVRPADP